MYAYSTTYSHINLILIYIICIYIYNYLYTYIYHILKWDDLLLPSENTNESWRVTWVTWVTCSRTSNLPRRISTDSVRALTCHSPKNCHSWNLWKLWNLWMFDSRCPNFQTFDSESSLFAGRLDDLQWCSKHLLLQSRKLSCTARTSGISDRVDRWSFFWHPHCPFLEHNSLDIWRLGGSFHDQRLLCCAFQKWGLHKCVISACTSEWSFKQGK